MKKYNLIFQQCIESQSIYLLDNVNGYTVINQGLTDCAVNGVVLKAGTATASGESLSIGGNENEIFKGRIDLKIDTNIGNVQVIQKIYLP